MTPTEDRDVVIAAPVRTPIGRFGGDLSSLGAAAMGAMAGRESLQRAGVDAGSQGSGEGEHLHDGAGLVGLRQRHGDTVGRVLRA